MIGRHAVAEHRQRARTDDIRQFADRRGDAVEKRRRLDVQRILLPLEQVAFRHRQTLPVLVAVEHLSVLALEHRGVDRARNRIGDFFLRGPDIAQVNRRTIRADAERLAFNVNIDRPRDRISDHQRRRREIIEAHDRIDPPFKVAIAAQDRARHQIALLHRTRDIFGDRSAVADTRRASVADQIEVQLLERFREPRVLQILRDDFRAGRETGLDPRLDRKPARDGLFREQSRRHHHRRIRGVGATRDRRDHERTVGQRKAPTVVVHFDLGRIVAELVVERRGLDRLRRRSALFHPLGQRVAIDLVFFFEFLDQLAAELGLGRDERHAILRTARTGETRHHGREIEFERVGEARLGRIGGAKQSLHLAVRLDQFDLRLGASGQSQIGKRLIVHRKKTDRRAVLGRHVAERRAIGDRQRRQAGTEVFDEFADHALLAQHLRDRQHQVGRGRTGLQTAAQAEADDLGNQHRHRAPEHRGLRLDSTDAPSDHAQSIDHRGMRIGAEHGVGIGLAILRREHHWREIFEIHLMHDSGVGRHHAEVVERALPPTQEQVALLVAFEFELRVGRERRSAAERIDLHRMIDHEIDRLQRTDFRRITAEPFDRIAHHCEVCDHRHSGEILQQHARRHERHFALAALARPAGERLDLSGRHDHPVLAPEHVLDHHLDRVGHLRKRKAALFERLELEDGVVGAIDRERRARAVTIACHFADPRLGEFRGLR